MMKSKARKLLSLLLTLAMVVGMFVLPASAANDATYIVNFTNETEKRPASVGIFTCNHSSDMKTELTGSGTSSDGETLTFTKACYFDSSAWIKFTAPSKGKLIVYTEVTKDSDLSGARIALTPKGGTLVEKNLSDGEKQGETNTRKVVFENLVKNTEYTLTRTNKTQRVFYCEFIAEAGIELPKTATLLATDGSVTLTATVDASTEEVSWSSSAEDVATVAADPADSKKGVVTLVSGVTSGSTVITATLGTTGKTATCTVTVSDHAHVFDGAVEDTATCTAPGKKTIHCSVQGCQEITEVDSPAKGHNWGSDDVCQNGCGTTRILGVLQIWDTNIAPTSSDAAIKVGSQTGKDDSKATLAEDGYGFELFGSASVGGNDVGSLYKGQKVTQEFKMNGGSRGMKFTAPDNGTLTLYFGAGTAADSKITWQEDDGQATEVTGLKGNSKVEITTKPSSTYTITRTSGNSQLAYVIWTISDWSTRHPSHTYGTAVTENDVQVSYCTNPVCLDRKTTTVESIALTHGYTDPAATNKGRGHTIYVGGTAQGTKDNFDDNTLKYPGSWKMDATILPAEANQAITWGVPASEDELATYPITVDQNGVVSANGTNLGTGTVTATAQGNTAKIAYCDVIVLPYISGVTINESAPETTMGVADADKLKLTATLTLEGGVTVDQLTDNQKKITWSVAEDDAGIVSVADDGTVTPLKSGTATVTATAAKLGPRADEESATVEVTVKPGTLNMTAAADNATQPANGGDAVITVNGVPEDKLAQVSVTALAAGAEETAKITGTQDGTSNKWKVTLPQNTGAAVTYNVTVSFDGKGDWTAEPVRLTLTQSAAGQKTLTVNLSTPDNATEIVQGNSLVITAAAKLDGTETTDVTYKWTKDGTEISGQTGSTLTVTEAGVYNCTVTSTTETDLSTTSGNPVTVTVKAPALQSITVAQKGTVDGVTYTAGATNTLVINGKKTVVFDVTMAPEVNDDELETELEMVNGLALVDRKYDAEAKTLTITPQRASVDENVPRTLTLKGTKNANAKWEVKITVKKLPAPAMLSAENVKATPATSTQGGGTITINNAEVGKTYRIKAVPSTGSEDDANQAAEGWTDKTAEGASVVFTDLAAGNYMVREKVADPTFQNISGSVKVTVGAYVPPSHAIRVDSEINDGKVTVDEEASEGSKVVVTVTPDEGYKLEKLWYVADGETAENAITATNGVYSFTMPTKDITIHATFVEGTEPAPAGYDEGDATKGRYVFDAAAYPATVDTPNSTETTRHTGTEKVGTSEYFTMVNNLKKDSKNYTGSKFQAADTNETAYEADDFTAAFTPSMYVDHGGVPSAANGRYFSFETKKAGVKVKVYWATGGTAGNDKQRRPAIFDGKNWSNAMTVNGVVLEGTKTVDKQLHKSTEFTLGDANTYYLGSLGNVCQIYKIVVLDEPTTPIEPTKYDVTVNNGTANPAKAAKGETVTVTAGTAPTGKVFDKWTSNDVTFADATKAETTFTMPEKAVTVTANFKDATTTPVDPDKPADMTNLNTVIANAKEAKGDVTIGAKADEVEAGVVFVTADVMKALDDAIAAAEAVAKKTDAKQADVDAAAKNLSEAITTFSGKVDVGTKTQGGTEPATPKDYVLNDVGFTATADKEFVTAGSFQKPFDITGEVKKRTVSSTDMGFKAYEIEKDGRGSITMKLEGTSSSIKAVLSSTGGSNTSQFTLKNEAGESIANVEGLTEVSGSARTTATWNNLPAGTYSLVAVKTDSNDKGMFVREITATTIVSGGDTPVDVANKDALKKAISDAEALIKDTKVSTDGSDVSTSEKWASEADVNALQSALSSVSIIVKNTKADQTKVDAATKKVTDAIATFTTAQKDGTKSSGSSSGGSSSSNVPSTGGGTTVKNEDGSKTTTKTNKATGTVTETTTYPNGDKTVVVTEKDGTKTETVTKKDGSKTETVTKPDGSTTTAVTDTKGIKTETAVTADGETSAKVTLPKSVDKTVVTIPVKDATEGTVAVIVDSKGNETVIKTAVATENGLELLVTDNVSVKIKDNAKKFVDIADDYWAKGAVDFVSSREIFKGVYETVFAPADLVNRGMMATVLYRLADAKAEGANNFFDVPSGTWYTDAVTWANRSGVVTGYADGTFGPADAVTREQMATMLFRYAKAMGMDISAKGDMSKFGDANDVSSWASEAMTWAVGVGLINGVADPVTGTTLSPTKTATRAEVATIMQRMVKLMMQ